MAALKTIAHQKFCRSCLKCALKSCVVKLRTSPNTLRMKESPEHMCAWPLGGVKQRHHTQDTCPSLKKQAVCLKDDLGEVLFYFEVNYMSYNVLIELHINVA